jgi:hypothetical protein
MSRFHAFTVVHRLDGIERKLGVVTSDFRSIRTLDPFISVLIRDGHSSGTVRLLEHDSGKVIFERRIKTIPCNGKAKPLPDTLC